MQTFANPEKTSLKAKSVDSESRFAQLRDWFAQIAKVKLLRGLIDVEKIAEGPRLIRERIEIAWAIAPMTPTLVPVRNPNDGRTKIKNH